MNHSLSSAALSGSHNNSRIRRLFMETFSRAPALAWTAAALTAVMLAGPVAAQTFPNLPITPGQRATAQQVVADAYAMPADIIAKTADILKEK